MLDVVSLVVDMEVMVKVIQQDFLQETRFTALYDDKTCVAAVTKW